MATIYSTIGAFLGWLDKLTGNYVVALLLFAVIVEILLLPLGIKQQKNSIRQAKLRPKEMAIRKKYAGRNDQATQQKVTMEIQELYQRENFNPMGGCLPLLIQLPIILILYNVVVNPMRHLLGMTNEMIQTVQSYLTTAVADGGLGLELAGKSSGTIELLSKIDSLGLEALKGLSEFTHTVDGTTHLGSDAYAALAAAFEKGLPDFNFLGMNLGDIPKLTEPSLLWIVPILTFVSYFASMKITRRFTYQPTTGNDQQVACSNKIMDLSMPAMSVYFTFIMPAAIGVYWIFKSILTTIKQIALHKIMPVPQFTEEDYRAAERDLAGKAGKKAAEESNDAPSAPANRAAQGGIAPVRSLHHIDDEDFEDTREQAEIRKRLIEEAQQKALEEKEKKAKAPGMKETNRHEKPAEDEEQDKDGQN